MQNVSKAAANDGFGRRLVYVRGAPEDVSRFESVCRDHDCVADIREVSATDREGYFTLGVEYGGEQSSILDLINDRGIFHHETVGVHEGLEQWFVYSDRKVEIKDLTDAIEANDNTVTINRMVDLAELGHVSNIEHSPLLAELTEQQRRTFETALEMQYYEADSETIVRDIADALGRHETTTWEHLKKAENAILTNVGEQLFPNQAAGTPEAQL